MEVKDALSHLRVLSDVADENALERALSSPPKGLGPSVLDPARAKAMTDGVTLYEAMSVSVSGWAKRAATAWGEWDRGRAAAAQASSLEQMARWAVEGTGLMDRALKLDQRDNTDRAANLAELVSVAAEFDRQAPVGDTPQDRLMAFLDSTVLVPEAEPEATPDAVRLMTIHASKGLEFPCVFLVGCDDGIFPSSMATTPDRMEEERRLAYVAITRAERRLCITSAQERMVYGRVQDMSPSRFIAEIPEEVMEWDSSSVIRSRPSSRPAPPSTRPYSGRGSPYQR
jgi:DNA helicase-2/ATP-dependent DNA helicase PcrA